MSVCRELSWQFLDSQVTVANSFAVVVVLETDVAGAGARLRIRPRQNEFSVHTHRIRLANTRDFVLVPLSQRTGIGTGRSLERVYGARAPGWVFRIRIAYLHFVALVHSVPGCIARI